MEGQIWSVARVLGLRKDWIGAERVRLVPENCRMKGQRVKAEINALSTRHNPLRARQGSSRQCALDRVDSSFCTSTYQLYSGQVTTLPQYQFPHLKTGYNSRPGPGQSGQGIAWRTKFKRVPPPKKNLVIKTNNNLLQYFQRLSINAKNP